MTEPSHQVRGARGRGDQITISALTSAKGEQMKTLLAFAFVFAMAAPALAANQNSSWEQIYREGLWPDFPKEWFQNYNVSVYSTCVDGDLLKATVSACTSQRDLGDGVVCDSYGDVILSKRISTSETVCVDDEGERGCRSYETFPRQIPLTYQVAVYSDAGGETPAYLKFTKEFTIPNCQ